RDFHVTGVQTCALPILRYDYDDVGHIIRAWWDDRLYGTFEYEGNILAKIVVPPNDTDPERTFPVTFMDGTYQAMGGSIKFKIDRSEERRVGKEGRSGCA